MEEERMIEIATRLGYERPMKKLDHDTLRVYGRIDLVYLRFVEGDVHTYTYSLTHSKAYQE